MEKSMSNVSGSSSGTSSYQGGRVTVIPKKCWCGAGIVDRISKSKANPNRGFYRCAFAAANLLRNDRHVFKWVDEAMREEENRHCVEVQPFNDVSKVEMLDYRVGILEGDVKEIKSGRIMYNSDEFDKMKMEIFDGVEEGLYEAKKSMKKLMVLMFCGCCVMVVLGLLVMKKVD